MRNRLPVLGRLVLSVSLLAAPHATPAVTAAHGGGLPWIYVEEEQVRPGEPFRVLVLDVSPFVTVRLEAETGDTRATLGEIETGAQGHGEGDVSLPADFPLGYANLRGVADDGTQVTAPLRVGDVPDVGAPVGPGAGPPGQPAAASALADPAVWTLGVILGGLLLGFAWRWLRRPSVAPPAPAALAIGERTAPRRTRKARRRR